MKKKVNVVFYCCMVGACMLLTACGAKEPSPEDPGQNEPEEIVTESIVELDSETATEEQGSEISENEYRILTEESVERDYTKYGTMKQEHEEFSNSDGSVGFYYDMECFYFDDSYPAVLNETLQSYYDSIREGYCSDAEIYVGDEAEAGDTPYDSLIFQYFTYVGDDYISIVYNNVCYMGGAHPYSAFDGITIDCGTGEIVQVSNFVYETEDEIGEQLQNLLGLDYFDINEWDYYITEERVVFFYYNPLFWDSVETARVR
ncbi:MAG: hypothetical protein ACI4DO_04405 [Roseburia sp.]